MVVISALWCPRFPDIEHVVGGFEQMGAENA
jgi:hypothetical protein